MKISACIITLNEEENLLRCLESIRDVVDEIVIVDSGSTDRTNYIATDFNARFIRNAWQGYVTQKNFALSKAKHLWVLSIDADEALSPELQESIQTLKSTGAPESVAGYEMPRVVYFQNEWIRFGDWYPDRLVRLFRKEQGAFAGGRVHERLDIQGDVQTLDSEIYHYSFTDWQDYRDRIEHYSTLWAEQKKEEGVSCNPLTPAIRALCRFFRSYLIKGGFRGGSLGFRLARLQAAEVYLKYKKLRK